MASALQLDSYDIIICGGGTAGLVLANRLTEIPSLTVLVLEAGENANDDPRISTPGLFALLYGDPDRDWCYVGEPSSAMNNRKIGYSRGKCLGGSSAINLMALVFPSAASLDAWESLGNPGWGWKGMEAYYRKFQRHCPPSHEVETSLGLEGVSEEMKGMNGPIASSYPGVPNPIQKAWVETFKSLGKHLSGDPLDGTSTGGYTSSATVDPVKGERSHAGVEYYAPVAGRENLHVVTGAMIDKVEFDTQDSGAAIATGVAFSHDGKTYTARAKKEVILSGGVVGSPSILERSGIGSKALCNDLGIKHIVDLPGVGENWQDHLMCGISYEVNDDITTTDMMRDPANIQKAMEQYNSSRSGPLVGGGGYSFAYSPLTNFVDPPLPQDEMKTLLDKYLPSTGPPADPFEAQHQSYIRSILSNPSEASSSMCLVTVQYDGRYGYNLKDLFTIHNPENYVAMIPQLAHPLSRGSSHIQSTDPDVHPIIKPNFLAHPFDTEILARHVMQVETLARTEPLSKLLKPHGKRLPEGYDAHTIENAIELVKASGASNAHPCGTCAMKPREMGGVLDSRLRVYGTKKLRVCDASIFPVQVRGNIQSTVYAAAEKGADILKEDLGIS